MPFSVTLIVSTGNLARDLCAAAGTTFALGVSTSSSALHGCFRIGNSSFTNEFVTRPRSLAHRTLFSLTHTEEIVSAHIVKPARAVAVAATLTLSKRQFSMLSKRRVVCRLTTVIISLHAAQNLILSTLRPSSFSLYVAISQPRSSISPRGLKL